MESFVVPVGDVGTEVSLSVDRRWPDEAWLDRARSKAQGSVFVFDPVVPTLAQARFAELQAVSRCEPGRGEAAKTWAGVETILDAAMERGVGRDGVVFGIGGGAICDVTAFAASVYMRGVAVELVPTTLLAMVDASVGGKAGINFRGIKNVVGSFHPALRIHMFLGALVSLPERELHSGLAEVLKAALLGEADLYRILTTRRDAVLGRDLEILAEVVRRALLLKARIVREDPKESGLRATLNLGHTFGHGLESAAGPGTLTHGEAVGWGIARALDLGVRLGHTDPAYRDAACLLLRDYGFALRLSELAPGLAGREERILGAMRQDKKKQGGGLRFVLQRDVGDTFLAADVPSEAVTECLSQET
jgi:3-dehydroquinate synthase